MKDKLNIKKNSRGIIYEVLCIKLPDKLHIYI